MAQGDAVLLAEANVTPGETMRYFGEDGDRMQLVFNFHVNQHLFLALATGKAQAARARRWRRPASCRRSRSGRCTCATTTSSTSAG